ncbi:S24 family peptidase [Pseudomonas kuykendallii]|uniref:S24 family peptidase n=1 Tax=Pseudomonas kuykendallii TaxID=1007099 RepID=UPI0028D3C218|nr:S24 family peptidase [Pseudomonas kuykendallii]
MDISEHRIAMLKGLIGSNSLKDFAEAHVLDASYLSQLLNRHRRLGDKAASNLEEKLGLPLGMLVRGAYSPEDISQLQNQWERLGLKPHTLPHPSFFNSNTALLTLRNEEPRAPYDHFAGKGAPIPVVGKAMLGTDGFFDDMEYPTGHGDGYLDIHSDDKNAYALRVVGNSMHPRIKNGEFVLVEPNHPYLHGDEVLVRTHDGKSMIKEFIYHRDGQYRFDSVNDGYPPVFLEESLVSKIHFVAGILKSSRYIDL